MKILFINTVYAVGSTGVIIKNIGEYIEKMGGEYRVAIGRGSNSDKHVYRIGSNFDMYFHAFLSRISDRAGCYSKSATKRFIDFVRVYRPDVIHLHNLHGYYINLKILFHFLKFEYKGKVFWTLHDCWPITGHCVHFSSIGCEKWKDKCYNCMQKGSYPTSYFFDSSNKNYEEKKNLFKGIPNLTLVTVSEWLKTVVAESFLKGYPIMRIYNGVDLNKFCNTPSDIKKIYKILSKKVVLLVADGFDDKKGLPILNKLVSQAPADWQFVVIGINRKNRKQLSSNVICVERTSNQQELVNWYSAADVLFNPSIEETFGLVTAEAMACGTPAVVMKSTACPELIINNNCGTVLDININPQEAIQSIECAMKKTGARNSAKFFAVEKQCQSYYELYSC